MMILDFYENIIQGGIRDIKKIDYFERFKIKTLHDLNPSLSGFKSRSNFG